MFDHIERRPLLEKPAGKHALPALIIAPRVGLTNEKLYKCSGQRLRFPGRGLLAGPQANQHIANARRFARAQPDLTRDTISLVEQPQHRNPIFHRRHAGQVASKWLNFLDTVYGQRFFVFSIA
jgi:hypothetical protein